jgi:hypothetical protein
MSGSRVRRTIVLALVLTAGSLPAPSVWAAQAFRTGHEAPVRQEGVFRTLMDNAWSFLQSALGKEHDSNDKARTRCTEDDPAVFEGPTICPLGICIPPR